MNPLRVAVIGGGAWGTALADFVSEIGHQDVWQRARVGAVSIGPDRKVLERVSTQFIRESERILGGELVRYDVEFLECD